METFLKKEKGLWEAYQKTKAKCRDVGEKQMACEKMVDIMYLRKLPGMDGLVYPWTNYDWDYSNYVNNNYNKDATGATDAGTFGALFKNPEAMFKLAKGFMMNPDPPNNASSAYTDAPICKPGPDYKGCEVMNAIRKEGKSQKPPYPDPFFNKPLNGQSASSYFIQSGVCPQSKMNEKECKDAGYDWIPNPLYEATPAFLRPSSFIPGSCFKRKYGYVKNMPGIQFDFNELKQLIDDATKTVAKEAGAGVLSGLAGKGADMAMDAKGPLNKVGNAGIDAMNKMLKKFKGEIPSLVNDGLSLSPLSIEMVAKGKSNPYFTNQKCEGFSGCPTFQSDPKDTWILVGVVIILILMVMFIARKFRNFSSWGRKN